MEAPQAPDSGSGQGASGSPSGPAPPDESTGSLSNLKQDLPASLVVFFVAVPLCLGIALASGAPLFSGLVAGIIGGIVVGTLSGSPLGVSGPAAGLAVIVATAIKDLGAFDTFLLAVVLAGGIQIVLGSLRAGLLAYFFPSSVIKGMLAGIGLLIILKQIPHAFGHDDDPEGDVHFQQPDGENTLSALAETLGDLSIGPTIVSVCCLFILIFWEQVLSKRARIFQLIQGPLVAILFATIYQVVTARIAPSLSISPDHLVQVPVGEKLTDVTTFLTGHDWRSDQQLGSLDHGGHAGRRGES